MLRWKQYVKTNVSGVQIDLQSRYKKHTENLKLMKRSINVLDVYVH